MTRFIPHQGVKACGLSQTETLQTCVEAGVAMIGFVFFDKSPRNISVRTASSLGKLVPETILKVGLFVKQNPDEILRIQEQAGLTALQLHGTYGPDDLDYIRSRCQASLIAIKSVSSAEDFQDLPTLEPIIDCWLFDAKPPKNSDRPGGQCRRF